MIRINNVRKITKFKRSVKAISPVIATLLMIAIAVVASLVVYAWVGGYMGSTTTKAGKAIQIQSYAPTGVDPLNPTNLLIYVQNVGQGDVELSQTQSVYIDSNLVTISNPNTAKIPITVGQTVELTVPLPAGYQKGDTLEIKVTTTDGTFMTASGKGTSTTGGGSSGTQYAVTVAQGGNGVIAPGTTSYAAGSTPSFTITPNSGYQIASITANGASVTVTTPAGQTYQFAALSAAATLTATYSVAPVQYAVTVTQGGNGVIAPGTTSYAAGSTPSFTITPNSGYQIASITANGASVTVTTPAGQTYQFAALSAAATLTATYSVAPVQYAVTVTQGGNGVIAPGTTSYAAGSTPSFTVTPNTGYHIVTITANGGSVTVTTPAGQTYQFAALSAAATLTATYGQNTVATKLVFSAGAPQTLTAGVVSPTGIVIQLQDASNNPVSATSATTVTLSTTSSGGKFYSDSAGTTQITSITIASGSSSSAGFYYKDTVAASPTLTGAFTGLTSATTSFTIGAASASKLVFTVAPTTVAHFATSTVFTVQRQDQYGNPTTTGTTTVSLSDNSGRGAFFSDSQGNNGITSVTIASGASTGNFYWEYQYWQNFGSKTITAAATGLTSATTNINVT